MLLCAFYVIFKFPFLEFPPLGQQHNKPSVSKGSKLNAKAEVSYQIMLPSLTPAAALEFMVDSWCFLLSGLQKNRKLTL